MQKIMRNKGITLIALVITIIVLLILAGITISLTIGNQGVITRAQQASKNYKDASEEEQRQIAKANAALNKETYKYTSKDGKTVPIPAGFAPTQIDGEDSVKDGLVIIDADGNEFVWIPCTVTQYEEAKDDVIDEDWSRGDNYNTNGGKEGKEWRDDYEDTDIKKINEVYNNQLPTSNWIEEKQTENGKKSIEKYGGFYIARYEAGIPEHAPFYANSKKTSYVNTAQTTFTIKWDSDNTNKARGSVADTDTIKNLKPVSKKGVQAWNYITQPNAKVVSENMYKDKDDVKSYLVDSQAWNHICKNIYKAERGTDKNDSTTWGNYYTNTSTNYSILNCLWAGHKINNTEWTIAKTYEEGKINEDNCPRGVGDNRVELSTGASDDFKKYNIYDMAGNMWEWTTLHNISSDSDSQMYVVPRGGSFTTEGAERSVVRAEGVDSLTQYSISVGFRVVLYIK